MSNLKEFKGKVFRINEEFVIIENKNNEKKEFNIKNIPVQINKNDDIKIICMNKKLLTIGILNETTNQRYFLKKYSFSISRIKSYLYAFGAVLSHRVGFLILFPVINYLTWVFALELCNVKAVMEGFFVFVILMLLMVTMSNSQSEIGMLNVIILLFAPSISVLIACSETFLENSQIHIDANKLLSS
jgi:hypothetical protein